MTEKDDFYPNGKENSKNIDANKLAYILLSRGILSSRDFEFLTGTESFEDWRAYNKEHYKFKISLDN